MSSGRTRHGGLPRMGSDTRPIGRFAPQRVGPVEWKEAQQMADDYDRDTVVVRDSGSSAGMILGIIAVIIVLAGLWYFALGPGSSGGGSTTQENNTNIEVPAEEPVEPAPS
jgi:hypothetical protein